MPKRTDLQTILLIGSGPIVIGQACEFDYSGVQACKALREEGYRVVLVNSNPATIMTDPEFADRTYIEPMTAEVLEQIIAVERPEAILPTIGGQTVSLADQNNPGTGVYFKRLDGGANIFVGYEFANNLTLTLNSQVGLVNINPENTSNPGSKMANKNTGFGLNLGYRF